MSDATRLTRYGDFALEGTGPEAATPSLSLSRRRRRRAVGVTACAAVLAAAAAYWLHGDSLPDLSKPPAAREGPAGPAPGTVVHRQKGSFRAAQDAAAVDQSSEPSVEPAPAGPDSLAVVASAADAGLAAGLVADLTRLLATLPGLRVLSPRSAAVIGAGRGSVGAAVQGPPVRYLLRVSFAHDGERIKLDVRLEDQDKAAEIWARRYDTVEPEFLLTRHEVRRAVAGALGARQEWDAKTEPAATLPFAAYEWALRAAGEPEPSRRLQLLDEALAIEPFSGLLRAAAAMAYWQAAQQGWHDALEISRAAARRRARALLDGSLETGGSVARQLASEMALNQRLHAEAVRHAQKAVELDPSDPAGYRALSAALAYDGRPHEAVTAARRALEVDPTRPGAPQWWMGRAHLLAGDAVTALEHLERAEASGVADDELVLALAIAYTLVRRDDEAVRQWRHYLDRKAGVGGRAGDVLTALPFKQAETATRFAQGLRRAGLVRGALRYYAVSASDRLADDEIRRLVLGHTITGFDPVDEDVWAIVNVGSQNTKCERPRRAEAVRCAWRDTVSARVAVSWAEQGRLCERAGLESAERRLCFPVYRNPRGSPGARDEYLSATDAGVFAWSPIR